MPQEAACRVPMLGQPHRFVLPLSDPSTWRKRSTISRISKHQLVRPNIIIMSSHRSKGSNPLNTSWELRRSSLEFCATAPQLCRPVRRQATEKWKTAPRPRPMPERDITRPCGRAREAEQSLEILGVFVRLECRITHRAAAGAGRKPWREQHFSKVIAASLADVARDWRKR